MESGGRHCSISAARLNILDVGEKILRQQLWWWRVETFEERRRSNHYYYEQLEF
jgi:hypothetical protein